jgi:molybdopterin/thiamine biosynthesis adenylyltransferase
VPGPLGQLASRASEALPDRDRTVVAYCATGVRSLYAAAMLRQLGYRDVVNLGGGIEAWQREGRPIEVPREASPDADGAGLTAAQRERYSRQLLIPEVGPEGQARLLASRVVVVGAGGLGSPAALYLAAAGVGTLQVVDFDLVDVSNLHRQVLHTTEAIGEPKVESARRAIEALNPDVTVVAREAILDADTVDGFIAEADVILDGTDSFETRYVLNDAAVRAGIPVVHASVFRFEGQVTTFVPFEGPCYRCLYPSAPPPELAPPCSVVGVLGVVPGVMGMLQATEVLKLLLGVGRPLVGRLLVFDALDSTFTELSFERDPACPACGDAVRAGGARGGSTRVAASAQTGSAGSARARSSRAAAAQ